MSVEEEARAMQFRQDRRARNAEYRQRLAQTMPVSGAYRQQLAEDWEPYISARIPIDDIPLLEDEAEERIK